MQAMRTLFLIIIVTTMLWLPWLISNSVAYTRGKKAVPKSVFALSIWLSLSSSAINPMIFIKNKKFNQRFRELFCKCVPQMGDLSTGDTNTTQNTLTSALGGSIIETPNTARRATAASTSQQTSLRSKNSAPFRSNKINTLSSQTSNERNLYSGIQSSSHTVHHSALAEEPGEHIGNKPQT